MKLLDSARVITLLCTGLYAGIIFGDRMGASFARPALSAADFVIFQQIQHVHFKPLLIPITVAAIIGGLVWVWSLRSKLATAEFWLAAAGTGAVLAAAVLTRIVNFPINDALMTWIPASPPPDMRAVWLIWEHSHTIRAALILCGFLFQVLALNSRRSA